MTCSVKLPATPVAGTYYATVVTQADRSKPEGALWASEGSLDRKLDCGVCHAPLSLATDDRVSRRGVALLQIVGRDVNRRGRVGRVSSVWEFDHFVADSARDRGVGHHDRLDDRFERRRQHF